MNDKNGVKKNASKERAGISLFFQKHRRQSDKEEEAFLPLMKG
jgi:transposase